MLNSLGDFSNSFVLFNDYVLKVIVYVYQFFVFVLGNFLDWNIGYYGNYFGNIFFVNGIVFGFDFFFLLNFGKFQLMDEFGFFILEVCSFFVLLVFYSLIFLIFEFFDFFFQFFDMFRNVDIFEMYLCVYFIEYVNCFIR